MTKRDVACFVWERLLGTPYKWGGDDPSGFDCSGLVVEGLKSVGILKESDDRTAMMLAIDSTMKPFPDKGDLVFFGSAKDHVTHVEIVWVPEFQLSLGAAGGGSKTLTEQDAWEQNAYIKIRPWTRRSDVLWFGNPFKGG